MSSKSALNPRDRSARGRRIARLPTAIVCAVAAIFSLGIGLNGLNNAFGNAIICAFGAGTLLLLMVFWPPRAGFFAARAAPVALVAIGTGCALLPNVLPSFANLNLRPDLMLSEILGIAGVLCALVCGSRIGGRRADIGVTVDALIALAVVISFAGFVLRSWAGELPFDIWHVRNDSRFTGTLGNANVAGTYSGMMAALAFSRLLAIRFDRALDLQAAQMRLARACAYLVALTGLLGACFLTGSRSAGAATLIVLMAIAILRWRREGRARSNIWALLAAVAVGLLIVAVGISDLFFDRLDAAAGGDTSTRPVMWAHYTQLFLASPWFGYGLGSFETLNAQFLGDPLLAQGLWTVNSAHNLVLQFLLDGGVIYFAMIAIAAATVGRALLNRCAALRWAEGSDGIIGALAIAIACAMVDIALDVPAMALLAAFMAGLLWAPARRPSQDPANAPQTNVEGMSDRPRFAG